MPKMGMEPVRRKQVIKATLDCIASNGFEGLTLDLVASKAGVSKGVVSYYFKGKADLISQSLEAFFDHYSQLIGESLKNEVSALAMLDRMIELTVLPLPEAHDDKLKKPGAELFITLSGEGYFKLLVHYYARIIRDDELKALYLRFYYQYLEGIVSILEVGRDNSEFSLEDSMAAAYGIMARLDGAILYQAVGFHPLNSDQLIQSCKRDVRQILS